MYQLTQEEKDDLVANCDHLSALKFSPQLPYVFTEHGAVMLAPQDEARPRVGFRRKDEQN
jgi:hypothetical protein